MAALKSLSKRVKVTLTVLVIAFVPSFQPCCRCCDDSPAAINNIVQDRVRELESQRSQMGGGGGFGGGGMGGGRGGETIEVAVPNQAVGLVIGRGGSTIKSIQDRTGANIQVPKGPDADDMSRRTLTVSGPSRQVVEDAKREILAIAAQDAGNRSGGGGGGFSGGGGGYQAPAPSGGVTIVIPNDRAGLIIGKGGATIHEMQQRTGTHIQIPQMPDAGTNPPLRTILITGNPQGCDTVRAEIYNLISVCLSLLLAILASFDLLFMCGC